MFLAPNSEERSSGSTLLQQTYLAAVQAVEQLEQFVQSNKGFQVVNQIGDVSLEQQGQFHRLLEARNASLVRLKDMVENACFDAPVEAHLSVRLFKYLFDQGDVFALYLMGTCFLSGLGGLNQDINLAIRLFQKASDKGIQHAKNALGGIYYNMAQNAPERTSKKYERNAVKFFMEAAEAGNAFAQSNMGFVYDRGVGGVEVNSEKALYWYRQALLSNDPVALNNAGLIYLEGALNVPTDHNTAVKFFESSAAQGNCAGLTSLGVAYEFGHGGLTADKKKALELYRRAARHGHPDALANVACMYWKGEAGLPVDYGKSLYLYELSAQFKSDPSTYQLNCLVSLLKNSGKYEQARKEADRLHEQAVFGPSYGGHLISLYQLYQSNRITYADEKEVNESKVLSDDEFQYYTKRFNPWEFRETKVKASVENFKTFFSMLDKLPMEVQMTIFQSACASKYPLNDAVIFLENCKNDLHYQLESQGVRKLEPMNCLQYSDSVKQKLFHPELRSHLPSVQPSL